METPEERLLRSWPDPVSDHIARDLLLRYREPHRHYHDVRHLGEVLAAVERLGAHAEDLDAVRLAAWFHDAVYDPRAADNEDRSARLARAALPALLGEGVAALVRGTRTHQPAPGDADAAVLCDADLTILGASTARYDAYAADVRREYSHVPDQIFAATRAAILESLLARERLYVTDSAYAWWEPQARRNLRRELIALGGGAARQR